MSYPTEKNVQRDAIIIAQYRAELERLNYVRGSINVYLHSIWRLFRLMEEQGIALGDLTPDDAADLVRRASRRCDRQQYVVFIVKRFVEYLAAQGITKPAASPTPAEMTRAALRRDYEDYLHRQRGLSNKTITSCWYVANRFLTFRFGGKDLDLGRMTPGDIVAFLQRQTGRKTPYRDKTQPTHLRNFFQYLFKE